MKLVTESHAVMEFPHFHRERLLLLMSRHLTGCLLMEQTADADLSTPVYSDCDHMASAYKESGSHRQNTQYTPSNGRRWIVLWRCWLGGRKGIRPVKNWVVGCWRGYLGWGADFIWPSRCHCHSLSLAPVNPDWFYLPGFYLSGTCSPGWSRTYSRRAVKRLCCVCVFIAKYVLPNSNTWFHYFGQVRL